MTKKCRVITIYPRTAGSTRSNFEKKSMIEKYMNKMIFTRYNIMHEIANMKLKTS